MAGFTKLANLKPVMAGMGHTYRYPNGRSAAVPGRIYLFPREPRDLVEWKKLHRAVALPPGLDDCPGPFEGVLRD